MKKVKVTLKSKNGTEFTRNINTCSSPITAARLLHKQYKGYSLMGYEGLNTSKFVTGNDMVQLESNFTIIK